MARRRNAQLVAPLVTALAIAAAVVTAGWLLGGPVGLGTLLFALTIGPSVQLGFRLLRVPAGKPLRQAAPPAATES